MARRIIALLLLAAALAALLAYSQRRSSPAKVSGFVETDEVRVGSRVGGRVRAVHVKEGDEVRVGDPLVELEPFDLLERRAEAQALLAVRTAELAKLLAGARAQELAAAAARRDRAQALMHLAQLKFERIREMFNRNAATRDERDTAEQELAAAAALLEEQRQTLAELEAGTRPEEVERARAAVAAAESAVQALDRMVEELTITAPVDGRIEALDLQPGDLVSPNAPVLSLSVSGALWVRAYVPAERSGLRVGQRLSVSVDGFPGRRFAGHVTFIARHAEFTPGNVQTPEDRAGQVFRIKVTLEEGRDLLRPGMNADVWLDTAEP